MSSKKVQISKSLRVQAVTVLLFANKGGITKEQSFRVKDCLTKTLWKIQFTTISAN